MPLLSGTKQTQPKWAREWNRRVKKREREWLKKAERQQAHQKLQAVVVKEALALWRERYHIAERPRGFSVTPAFARACAALEKFETGGKKR